MFVAGKYGTKSVQEFHYSTDGEHFTKAYKNKSEAPHDEKTITHADALEILKKDKEVNPSTYEEPAFGVAQTKVFRVSVNANKTHNTIDTTTEYKTSWLVISKNLENTERPTTKTQEHEEKHKRAYYSCKTIYAPEITVRSNKSYKLVWPASQGKSLVYLIELCKDLILSQSSKTLGEGNQFYAVIYEKKTTQGPEGLLYKALVTQGEDKTQASQTACSAIQNVWQDGEKNNTPKAITCLSLTDCSLLKHLIEMEI